MGGGGRGELERTLEILSESAITSGRVKIKVSEIQVTPLENNFWRLAKDVDVEFAGVKRTIPAGMVFDFASIPKALKLFFPYKAIYSAAALVHDDAYTTAWVSKWVADALLAEIMEEAGMKKTGLVMWLAVALFGSAAWKSHRKTQLKES
jgi:hypothetical protein